MSGIGNGLAPGRAAGAGLGPGRILWRQGGVILLAGVFVWGFRDRWGAIDLRAVLDALRQIGAFAWLTASLAALVSFTAIAQYDVSIHRYLETGVTPARARRAGASAIAVSQLVGMGLLSGTLVRWRMLPEISLAEAARLSVSVTALFLSSWAVVAASVTLASSGGEEWMGGAAGRAIALLVLVTAVTALGVAFWWPRVTIAGRSITLPPIGLVLRLLGLATVDICAAALVIWALLGGQQDVQMDGLATAYALALGASLFLSTPGGVGPFDVLLLGLLPQVETETLVAALFGYRLLYVALPAMVAGLVLIVGPGQAAAHPAPDDAIRGPDADEAERFAQAALRAETGLVRAGGYGLLSGAETSWLVGRSGQSLAALFDPSDPRRGIGDLLCRLQRAARTEGRTACLYKCSARTAATARGIGFSILPVADEMVLDPADFAPSSSLRRKLRKAERSGVTIRRLTAGDPVQPDIDLIADEWAKARGGERGFSMGRHDAGYLRGQRVYLAECGGEAVAFASFHAGRTEWVLDLMRSGKAAPDGTMHLIVASAIGDASSQGLRRVTLAALPCRADGMTGAAAFVFRRMAARPDMAGLTRFKSTFGARRERRYIAAPSPASLVLAAADIARAIRHPDRIVPFPPAGKVASSTSRYAPGAGRSREDHLRCGARHGTSARNAAHIRRPPVERKAIP